MQDRAPNLLESWKEIAAFLRRDKRTAMRWAAAHGMPVHRYPGHKQGRVFAYREELEAWFANFAHDFPESPAGNDTGLFDDYSGDPIEDSDPEITPAAYLTPGAHVEEEAEASAQQQSSALDPPRHSESLAPLSQAHGNGAIGLYRSHSVQRRLVAVALGISFVAVAAFAVFQLGATRGSALKAAGLVRLTDDARSKLVLRTDGKTLYFDEMVGANRMLASARVQGGPVQQIPTPFSNVLLRDISPDGKSLLILSRLGIEPENPLWTIPVQGGAPNRIGQIRCAEARWSPDGRWIAFTAGNSLSIADSEGRTSRLVQSFEAMPGNLVWSPDGHILRFMLWDPSRRTYSPWELTFSAPGFFNGPARQLLLTPGCCADWTWTNNGRKFAYVVSTEADRDQQEPKDQRLVLAERFRTKQELSVNLGRVHLLTSDKDGQRLYFLISSAQRGELLRFNKKDNAFQSQLTGLSAQSLSYSRDGKWLSYSLSKDQSLWRSKSDGTGALLIAGSPLEAAASSWSPDGREIAFVARYPGKPWRIYLIGRDGGTPHELTAGEDNQGAPTWSPDGKTIAYGRVYCEGDNSCAIVLIDVETGRTRLLPESENLRTARWSPDGRYLAAIDYKTHVVRMFDWRASKWSTLATDVGGDDLAWSRDSRFLYVSCLTSQQPTIDRVSISNRSRVVAVDLTPLQKMPGELSMWFGLSPDDSPIVFHFYTASEVYALNANEP